MSIQPKQGTDPGGLDGQVDGHHNQLSEASRAMVRLYKEQFGRGPVKAHSAWAGHDMVVCTLEESLTPAERNLRDMGEHQRLRDVRMFFQYSTVKEFIDPIERIFDRTVRSFVSGMDTHADVAIEAFLFYPVGAEGESRSNFTSV
jgi:uncharacterized protein YbcI